MELTQQNLIEIPIPNTIYWVMGERTGINLWNLYLTNPKTGYKGLIKENMTTKAFAILSNMTLHTPFPYVG